MVNTWRRSPFNPFVLADLRPVAYMKSTVMAYLDNLIGWADNLFASESREALSEATLLYVIASEILGAQPQAVTPPEHADESFDQLEPALDAFANAMVEIENVIGGAGAGGGGDGGQGGVPLPAHLLLQDPVEPEAARLLDDGRRPPVQTAPLPDDHGRAAAAGAVRCTDRSGAAGRGAGRRRRSHAAC